MDLQDREGITSNVEEAVQTKEALLDLTRTRGWDTLSAILKEQIRILHGKVLRAPLASENGVFEQEFNKGHAHGLELALSMPQVMISALDDVISRVRQLEPDEDHDAPG